MIFNALGLLVIESLAVSVLFSNLPTETKVWALAVSGGIIILIVALVVLPPRSYFANWSAGGRSFSSAQQSINNFH